MSTDINFGSCSGAPLSVFATRGIRIGVRGIVVVGSRVRKNVTDDPGFANIMRSLLFSSLKQKPGSYGIRP
jgi:hypothetical protein